MEIKLLKNGYKKSDQFYNDFLEDQIRNNDYYFSGDVVYKIGRASCRERV